MRPWPLYGMYQPDAIKFIRIGDTDYIITANEGDSKDYTFFSEEKLVKEITLSSIFGKFKQNIVYSSSVQFDQHTQWSSLYFHNCFIDRAQFWFKVKF